MAEQEKLICHLCQVELVETPVGFSYLGHRINHQVPACPSCGQVYITRELALGKIKEVEAEMEEK